MCSPQESINFTKLILPESSDVKIRPRMEEHNNKRETISAWKTVLGCLTLKWPAGVPSDPMHILCWLNLGYFYFYEDEVPWICCYGYCLLFCINKSFYAWKVFFSFCISCWGPLGPHSTYRIHHTCRYFYL